MVKTSCSCFCFSLLGWSVSLLPSRCPSLAGSVLSSWPLLHRPADNLSDSASFMSLKCVLPFFHRALLHVLSSLTHIGHTQQRCCKPCSQSAETELAGPPVENTKSPVTHLHFISAQEKGFSVVSPPPPPVSRSPLLSFSIRTHGLSKQIVSLKNIWTV